MFIVFLVPVGPWIVAGLALHQVGGSGMEEQRGNAKSHPFRFGMYIYFQQATVGFLFAPKLHKGSSGPVGCE